MQVRCEYRKTSQSEKFDFYDVVFAFVDNNTVISESTVSSWGVPIGTNPEDSVIEGLALSLQTAIDHIEKHLQK